MSELETNKTKIIAIIVIGIVVIGGGVIGIGKWVENLNAPPDDNNDDDDEEPEAQVFFEYNKSIIVTDINNDTYDLSEPRDKFVILYFYSLTCGPCAYHAPNLWNATKNYSTDEMLVITVSVSSLDKDYKVQAWADSHGYEWVLVAEEYASPYSSQFQIQFTPTTIYIGTNNIMRTEIGYQEIETIQENIESVQNYENSTASVSTDDKIACKPEE